MSAPRDLVAEARTMAAEIHPGHRYLAAPINRQMAAAGNLLTELADEVYALRVRAAAIRYLAATWSGQVPVDDAAVQQIEDGCALLLLIDGRALPEEPQ
ncbi:hypothetical protein [Nocardia fluminea]|uniref:Uncharacterized protein n=1 Tax=Nocardia fluminea TaxID=134984 RepID=A0A2N3VGW9_9NOCA|nr:hypothetical protein [Nocardia fluminea]PKV80872.1 hypothetical protein ATK86_5309 [Nocardia fluminea]